MIVLTAAWLLCVLAGQLFENEGSAPLRELVRLGVQPAGAGQLQKLFSQLGRVSLQEQQHPPSKEAPSWKSAGVRAREHYLQRSGVVGHGAANPLVAAVLLDVGDPFLTLTHDLCSLQVEVFVDHLQPQRSTQHHQWPLFHINNSSNTYVEACSLDNVCNPPSRNRRIFG